MTSSVPHLVGTSFATQSVREELTYAARSDAKVLITGETGVGKEVVAQLVHREGSRSRAPFVTINCAGVPDTLLESELFGHVRGSFTGAYRDKPGLLELANNGTIFMDEVGEMSLRMQGLLLRFLENGELQRVGADHRQPRVNVRVIAATNRNLLERIKSGLMREDLYYRLNIIHLAIPPLRERREDIPVLFRHFLREFAQQSRLEPPALSSDALTALTVYDWPGNVRELRNLVERLLVRGPKTTITSEDLPMEVQNRARPVATAAASSAAAPLGGASSRATMLFERVVGGESFWSAVYEPFMVRDLTRDDLRQIVGAGLTHTNGSYKILVELFNMRGDDYKKFLNFLRKHDCHLPFHQFRIAVVPASAAAASGVSRARVA